MSENSSRILLLAGCRGSLLAAAGVTAAVVDAVESVMLALDELS